MTVFRPLGIGILVTCLWILPATASISLARPDTGGITSIKSLPTGWSGIGGDLFTKVSVSFSIGDSRLIATSVSGDATYLTYESKSKLRVGSVEFPISKLDLTVSESAPNTAEMVLYTDDQIVGNVFTLVFIDENNIFHLKETSTKGNAHRFVLSGDVPL